MCDTIQLKRDGIWHSVLKAEIICVDADRHYVTIYTKNDGVFRMRKGINKVDDDLADCQWHVRIWPSHLVHFLKVKTYGKGECVMLNGLKFSISEGGLFLLKMRIRQWEEQEKKKDSNSNSEAA